MRFPLTFLSCFVAVFLLVWLPLFSAAQVFAKPRAALVIGNASYRSHPLQKPVKDVADVAAALIEVGFNVSQLENLNKQDMEAALRQFSEQTEAGGVGLFYFAGYGITANGRNYLIPVDAEIEKEDDIAREAVDVDDIMRSMAQSGTTASIVILDASRSNPFEVSLRRGGGQGLAAAEPPENTFLAYSAAPGSQAAYGMAQNGLFALKLLERVREPGVTIHELLEKTSMDVARMTNNRQIPWYASSLKQAVYLGSEPAHTEEAAVPEGVAAAGTTSPGPERNAQPYQREGALAEAVDWYLGINGKEMRPDRARPLFMAAARKEDTLARMWLARCYQKGRVGFQKDEAEAKRLAHENVGRLGELADEGHPEAMFLLGAAYADGLGFPEDDQTAARWYRKAADRQHALAMNNLGWAYDYGNGVQQNLDEAIAWYEKAVEFGFTPATNNLAWMYANGRGVQEDLEKAAYWYQKGAEGGNPLSMVQLADLYQRGEGVDKDEHLAGFWFAKAADRGDASARASLKEYTRGEDGQWRKTDSDGGDRREEAGVATCFIATAAYGYSAEKHVLTLRLFREKWLNTNAPGRWLVGQYYRLSPPIAQKISKSKMLKGITRTILTPAAVMAGAFLGKPADLALTFCGLVAITAVFLYRRRRRRYLPGQSSISG